MFSQCMTRQLMGFLVTGTLLLSPSPYAVASAPHAAYTVNTMIELARAHLRCAKEIVERRTDLGTVQADVLTSINGSLTECDEAEAALDAAVPGIKNKVLREVDQLRSATTKLSFASISSNSAGNRLPGYVEPQLPQGYASNDPIASTADVMQAALDRFDAEAANLKARFDALKAVADAEGEAGVRRILASNTNPACAEFIKVKLLAELRSIAMIADARRRDDAIAAEAEAALAQIQADADAEAKLLEKAYPKIVKPIVAQPSRPTTGQVNKADKTVSNPQTTAKLSNANKVRIGLGLLPR